MKKLKFGYLVVTGMLLWGVSCKAPEEWAPKYDDVVPGPVSIVRVENVNGGAVIFYTLPADVDKNDLLGAKVVYTLTPDGEEMERWAFAANDSIELEGFGDTNERTVTVYAVHKNTKISTGVPATIKPLTPLISAIRETMKAAATFGGVQITWDNPLRKDMGISLYVLDSLNQEMVLFDKYFSNSIYGKTSFRPFDPEAQPFRIEVFDRWQNFAQPLDTVLTPLEEVEIIGRDANGNDIIRLFDDERVIPGDNSTPWRYTYRTDTHNDMTNSTLATRVFSITLVWHTSSSWWAPGNLPIEDYVPGIGYEAVAPFPVYFTIDMGRKAVYSRVEILARPRSPVYSSSLPVDFDIWGTNDPKTIEQVGDGGREANQAYWSSWPIVNGTDAWKNDWVKLASCKYFLSSGENQFDDNMQLSSEDIYQFQNGYEFDFNEEVAEPFRYLRWEVRNTNTSTPQMSLNCFRYWGSYAD